MADAQASTGLASLDDILGGLIPGDNVVWIPGYWSWDDSRNDFLWVSGIWRNLPPGRQWVPGYWSEAAGGFLGQEGLVGRRHALAQHDLGLPAQAAQP